MKTGFLIFFAILISCIILLGVVIYHICIWYGESEEVRAILKARGEDDRVLTYRERMVRRRKRNKLRKEYVSQYWVRNGCEPYDCQVNKYLNDWEVNAETPYLEGIK